MEFPNTPYSLFANQAQKWEALEYFCNHYRRPVIAFLKQRGVFVDRTEDMAHDFLIQFISSNALHKADRTRGRFRRYLLTALRRFMASDILRNNAQIRGGGIGCVSLDFEGLAETIPDENDPEVVEHDRQWAINLYLAAFACLAKEQAPTDQAERFPHYRPFFLPTGEAPSMASLAEIMGQTESATRQQLFRLRKRFVALFREEVAQTVATPEEIDEEVEHLLGVISSPGALLPQN